MRKILIVASCFLTTLSFSQEIGLKIGDIAPELAYSNPKGQKMKLSSLKGKVVLTVFKRSLLRL